MNSPKPAPNADAAIAPHSAAVDARKTVSSTWFCKWVVVSSWERSTAAAEHQSIHDLSWWRRPYAEHS
eukprot:COSAG02_NODE_235_length_27784_cov_9.895828_11_plen_68_part_00